MGTSTPKRRATQRGPAAQRPADRPRRARLRMCAWMTAGAAAIGCSSVAWAGESDVPVQRPAAARAAAPLAAPTSRTPPVTTAPATTTAATPSPTPTSSPAPPSIPPASDADAAAPARSAPPSPRAAAPAARSTSPAPGLHAERTDASDEKLEHRGLTFDGRIGAAGCLRGLCGPDSHNASPGLRLDGFLGGNIAGWVDLGVSGGWGNFRASAEPNSNLLRLYGVEPVHLQQAAVALGQPLAFNPFALQVHGTKLTSARVGPSLRVHLIPRGRGIAYIGTGFGYSLFRAQYDTAVGDVKLDFHGIDVPVQAGAGVQVTKHLAAVAQFDYTWAKYPAAQFDHPQENMTLPVRLLDTAASTSGNSVGDQLPQYWSFGVGLRARI